jgi:hypothetical protein
LEELIIAYREFCKAWRAGIAKGNDIKDLGQAIFGEFAKQEALFEENTAPNFEPPVAGGIDKVMRRNKKRSHILKKLEEAEKKVNNSRDELTLARESLIYISKLIKD